MFKYQSNTVIIPVSNLLMQHYILILVCLGCHKDFITSLKWSDEECGLELFYKVPERMFANDGIHKKRLIEYLDW